MFNVFFTPLSKNFTKQIFMDPSYNTFKCGPYKNAFHISLDHIKNFSKNNKTKQKEHKKQFSKHLINIAFFWLLIFSMWQKKINYLLKEEALCLP